MPFGHAVPLSSSLSCFSSESDINLTGDSLARDNTCPSVLLLIFSPHLLFSVVLLFEVSLLVS